MQFTVLKREIKAALLFASEDKSRYVINSVHFQCKAGKPTVLVSTNGRSMCILKSESQPSEHTFEVTISRDELKWLMLNPNKETMSIDITDSHVSSMWLSGNALKSTLEGSIAIKRTLVDATYPKYKQVIPKDAPAPVAFNSLGANLIEPFCKAARLLCPKRHTPSLKFFYRDELLPIEIRIHQVPGFYALLMQVRDRDDVENQQQWIKDLITETNQ